MTGITKISKESIFFDLNNLSIVSTVSNKYTDAFCFTQKEVSAYTEPERFYHGFVLGLMVELSDRYSITSNRESGFGRYDVMLKPKSNIGMCKSEGLHAIIIEFKVHDAQEEKSMQETVDAALLQIEEKQYDAALKAEGMLDEQIKKYGFAFEGKTVLIG